MRQVSGLIPTYSSDEFGICSALYELGGMVVMHDASGCNSTYTTHDEPRWYEMDSMIYISAISEMEAILGDDDKLLTDLEETANDLHPKFIALVGAPIPYMIGTDLKGMAQVTEHRTGIVSQGFDANGMQHYTKGISMGMEWLATQFCEKNVKKTEHLSVNILGATPLDFSINGTVEAIREWLQDQQIELVCCMAMGSSLEEIRNTGRAHVNLVISYGGLAAAKYMERTFGIPYVVGVPYGTSFSALLCAQIHQAAQNGENRIAYKNRKKATDTCTYRLGIIGESVTSASLGAAIEELYVHVETCVFCPIDTSPELLRNQDARTPEEDDLMQALTQVDGVVADPMYRVICPDEVDFYPLPHVACSGRCFEKQIPNLICDRLDKEEIIGD